MPNTESPRKPPNYKFAVGQIVRFIDSGKFTMIAKIDYDGTLYEGAGHGAFFGGCITKVSGVRPLTKVERGPR